MSVEFVDTNLLVYAHDGGAGAKHGRAVDLLTKFYAAATRKLGMSSAGAGAVIRDLGGWIIHRPAHADLVKAAQLHRRYKLGWWDALILRPAARPDHGPQPVPVGRSGSGGEPRSPASG
jgi:predicted nucleic acid-binding protein